MERLPLVELNLKHLCIRVDNMIERFNLNPEASPKDKLNNFFQICCNPAEAQRIANVVKEIANTIISYYRNNGNIAKNIQLKYGKYKDITNIYHQKEIQAIVTGIKSENLPPDITILDIVQEADNDYGILNKRNLDYIISKELSVLDIIKNEMRKCQSRQPNNTSNSAPFNHLKMLMMQWICEDLNSLGIKSLGQGSRQKIKVTSELLSEIDSYLSDLSTPYDESNNETLGLDRKSIGYNKRDLPSTRQFRNIQREANLQGEIMKSLTSTFVECKYAFKAKVCNAFLDAVHNRFTRSVMNALTPVMNTIVSIDNKLIHINTGTNVVNKDIIRQIENDFKRLDEEFIPLHLFFKGRNQIGNGVDEVYINLLMDTGGVEYSPLDYNPMPDDWLNVMMVVQLVYSTILSQISKCLESDNQGILEVMSKFIPAVKDTKSTYQFIYDNPSIIIRVFDVKGNYRQDSNKQHKQEAKARARYSLLNADMTFFYHVIKYYFYASEFSKQLKSADVDSYTKKREVLVNTYNKLTGLRNVDYSQTDDRKDSEKFVDVFTSVLSLRSLFEMQPEVKSATEDRSLRALESHFLKDSNRHEKPTLFTTRRHGLINAHVDMGAASCATNSPTIINNELLLVGRLYPIEKVNVAGNRNTEVAEATGKLVVPLDIVFQDIVSSVDDNGIKGSKGSKLSTRCMFIEPSAFLGLRAIMENPNLMDELNDKGMKCHCPFVELLNNPVSNDLQEKIFGNVASKIPEEFPSEGDSNIQSIESKIAAVQRYKLLSEPNMISSFLDPNYIDFYYTLIKISLDAAFNLKFSNTYQTMHYLSEDEDVLTGGLHYNEFHFEPA